MATHRHFKLYKPAKVVSQFIRNQKRKKRLLGEFFDFPIGTMAIGRLDEDSEGLLLLTTDGKVSERVRSKSVEKEYFVLVDGIINKDAVNKLQNGVLIGLKGKKYRTLPCKSSLLRELPIAFENGKKIRDQRHGPTSWLAITIKEGKFRQVRKMTAAVGFPTLRLIRVRIGEITLEGLQSGEVCEISL